MDIENLIAISSDGTLTVPDAPQIPLIEGDGIGPEEKNFMAGGYGR